MVKEAALLKFDVAVTGSTVYVPVPPVPVGPAVVEFRVPKGGEVAVVIEEFKVLVGPAEHTVPLAPIVVVKLTVTVVVAVTLQERKPYG